MLQRTIIISLFISLSSFVSAVGSGNLFGDLMQGMTKGLAQLNQQQNTNQPQWNFPPGLEPLSETRNNTNFPYPGFNQPYYAPHLSRLSVSFYSIFKVIGGPIAAASCWFEET